MAMQSAIAAIEAMEVLADPGAQLAETNAKLLRDQEERDRTTAKSDFLARLQAMSCAVEAQIRTEALRHRHQLVIWRSGFFGGAHTCLSPIINPLMRGGNGHGNPWVRYDLQAAFEKFIKEEAGEKIRVEGSYEEGEIKLAWGPKTNGHAVESELLAAPEPATA